MSFRQLRLWGIGLALFRLIVLPASGHLPVMAAATATIESDGTYSVDLTFDVPPFVLAVLPQRAADPAMNAWLDGPTNAIAASLAQARARFQSNRNPLATCDTWKTPRRPDHTRVFNSAAAPLVNPSVLAG